MYRIYRQLALNLRTKPNKRLIREVPDKLAELKGINDTGSMDFMHDPLSDDFGVSGSTELAEVSAERPELASIQPDR